MNEKILHFDRPCCIVVDVQLFNVDLLKVRHCEEYAKVCVRGACVCVRVRACACVVRAWCVRGACVVRAWQYSSTAVQQYKV